ncbi:hypothetical protein KAZ66_00320 [Candidatus Woesebacteria bacterium]|nr:hypothetical protein [Candidatus Woesebacteria bacterium]
MTDKNTMPSQFSIFKGKSAMRMQLQKPEAIEEKFKIGCIFLQIAPYKEERNGTRIFSWEDLKISIKLGVNDLTQLVYAIDSGGEAKLFHQFNDISKSIELKINGDKGWFFSVAQSAKDGTKSNLSIPISREEGYAIGIMLKAALPLIHNWY